MVKAEGVGSGGLLLRYDVYSGGGGELGKPTDRQGIALNWPPARFCTYF